MWSPVLAFVISSSDLISGPFAKESFHRIFKEQIEDLKIQGRQSDRSCPPCRTLKLMWATPGNIDSLTISKCSHPSSQIRQKLGLVSDLDFFCFIFIFSGSYVTLCEIPTEVIVVLLKWMSWSFSSCNYMYLWHGVECWWHRVQMRKKNLMVRVPDYWIRIDDVYE